MPDLEISNLPALAEASVQATDPLPIADLSASETKKVTVKDLIEAGVALIDNTSIPAAKVGTLATNQVASAAIQSGAVTNIKIETSTSSTTGIDGATKIRAGSVTVDRLDATKFDRGLSVSSSKLGISNSISAGTTSGITYTAQGLISGVAALGATDLPKATASAIGAVSVPTAGKLIVDSNGALSLADVSGLSAGSYAKVTVNVKGQVTAGTTLSATDVPLATTSARGAVIVPSSGGLAVDGSGNISIATQGSVSAGSYAKVTVNTKGIITGTGSLADTDIPNHSAAKLTSGTLPADRIGASAITTTRLNNGAVTNDKVETSTSSSTGLDGASKLRDGTVTAVKLNTTNIDRSLNVASGKLGINNTISAGTRSGITFNAQGLITGTVALVAGDLPLATTSAVGGVSVGTGLSVSGAGALSLTNSVTGAQVSGITFNNQGMITAATGLVAGDLPVATTSAKGAVQITSGGGLTVDGNGNLSTSTSGISAGTYGKLTVNNKGVATAGAALSASDIPVLDANKITTGSIAAARIGNDSIDGTKLSNTSTAIFQSIAQSGYPTAQFNGQILFDTVSEDAFIWDGNAWQAITTLTKGSLVFGGNFNANTSKMTATTTAGIAAGLAVGSNLPTPSATTDGVYVVVDTAGTPSAPAPVVAFSPPDYILGVTNSSGSSWNEIDLSQTVAGQVASNIVFTPYGQISATNVQDALQELETEKMGLAGGTCTGQLLISNTGSIVFEGSTVDAYELTLAVADPQSSDKTITFPDITGTLITTADTNTVTSTMVDASLVNANLAAGAAIAFSKLAALPSAQIIVGNGSTVPTAVAVTGDISINNAGLTAIAAGVIVNADVSSTAAIAGSKITTGTTSAVGVLQLTDSTSSTSATTAATPNAVKTAYDLANTANTTANAAVAKSGSTMTGNLIIDNGKELRLSEADSDGAHFTGLKAQAQSADIVLTLPATAPTTGQVLKSSSTATTLEWATDSANAAGSNTQVQFNNSGAFAGSASLTFNSGTGALTATSFVGDVTGDLTGTASSFTVTANNTTDETVYPLFVDGATGSQGAETDTGFTYNPSTGLLTSTGFSGSGANLTNLNATNLSSGTVNVARLGSGATSSKFLRGDNTWQTVSTTPEGTAILSTGESGGTKFLREDGDGTCSWQAIPTLNQDTTGSAATLTTARTINGTNFDGSADITVTAAAGTLTGTELKSTVVTSSLTSVGTLTGLVVDGDVTLTGAAANIVFDKSDNALEFADNAKATFGASDLSIYHDGTNSIIQNTTGDLIFEDTSGNLIFRPKTGEDGIKVYADGAVELFNNNVKTLATTSNGINILGPEGGAAQLDFNADEGDDNADKWKMYIPDGGAFHLQNKASGSWENSLIANSDAGGVQLCWDGSIKFATSSTGATLTGTLVADGLTVDTNTLYVDATNDRVGINTTTPDTTLDVTSADTALGSNGNIIIRATTQGADVGGQITFGNDGARRVAIAGNQEGSDALAGYLQFGTRGTSGDISERLRISSAGAIGIAGTNYGTSGQVLTSGGSSAAPSWADAGGGSEISGTASGSIAQDKACIVKTDGNLEQVVKSITQQSPALADTTDYIAAGNYLQNGAKIKWIAEKSCFIATYHTIDASNNRYTRAKVGILGTGSDAKKILWGPQASLSTANNSHTPALGYDPDSDHLVGLITYNGGSHSRIRSYTLTVDQSDASNCVIAYANQMTWQQYQNYEPLDVVYDYTAEKLVTILVSNSDGSTACRVIEVASSDGALSWPSGSSNADMRDNDEEARSFMQVRYIADIGKIAFGYIAGGSGSESLKFGTMNVNSNNSITFNTQVRLTDGRSSYNSGNGQPDNCIDMSWDYDKSIDRFVIVYMIHDGVDRGKTTIQIGNYDSSTGNISWTSRSSILSWSSGNYTSGNQQLVYEENAGRMLFVYTDPRDSNKTKAFTWTASTGGSGSNIGTPALLINANQTIGDMIYRSSIKAAVMIDRQNSNNVAGKSHSITSAVATTNMTTENFVGFAKAAATNGNSVDIKVVGNTSTQSSLTAGQKYYVQMDGTLGTSADTPSVEAGLALSSTSLLIR